MTPTAASVADWPLVGRAEELELLGHLRSSTGSRSVVISGSAGVGKSRLAKTALAEAAREGWATLTVRGSAGMTGVPLGAFRTVLPSPSSKDLADLTTSVSEELVAMRSAKGLLLMVDDGQNLDAVSLGLVHQLLAAGLVAAIITTRSGVPNPPELTEIWKDGLAERIDLQNLSHTETTDLLATGLGGPVQDSSANGIWQVTAGNPLYVREVVLASAETGALRLVEGEWRWRGAWAQGARLQEIVSGRLGRLDADELTAMEMLAVAGSLPLTMITGLSTARAIEGLEARGLVATEKSGQRLEITIAHPLHAEVLRAAMPELQQRSIRRNLVEALTRTGVRRTTDHVRLACWSLESGLDVDLVTLSLGADASLFGIGRAIAGRLQEIMPHALDLPPDGPVVRRNHETAIRLARVAYQRSGGVTEGVALASALGWTGATAQAEEVLADLAERTQAIDDRLRVALALGWVRFWGRYRVDEARRGMVEVAEAAGDTDCDRVLLAELFQQLAGLELNIARPVTALHYSEKAATTQGTELGESVAAAPAAAALAYLGRCGDALGLIDQAVPVAHASGHPFAVANLLFGRVSALGRMGQVQEALDLAEWLRNVALAGGLHDATGTFGVLVGEFLLRQGHAARASRIFRDSAGLLAERDVLGYRPWALSGLARARARAGEEASALAALEEARRIQPVGRHFDFSHYLAAVEIHGWAGRTAEAVEAATAGAAWARAAGMVGEEAQLLDAWVRIEPSQAIADRLSQLAATNDGDLVPAMAAHAQALVAEDPDALLATSERFAAMTCWWMAGEAAATAAGVLDRRRLGRPAKAAARAAARYLGHCEGTWSPAAAAVSGPTQLTKREREIAVLAAAGRPTKEIADRMYLSPRTVDNHLYRVYSKLGVTDRSALAAVLAENAEAE